MSAFVAEVLRGDGPVRATGVARPREESWVAGDIRLDGRDELRDALGGAGVATAKHASDGTLVLAAWRAWRETVTERLIGDFTFALWDHRERTLFCARDQLGVRPLYWAEVGRTFLCGNVLDDLRADPRVSRSLNEPAIVSFLVHGLNVDPSTTSFVDIRRLAPGHQLVVRDGSGAITPRRYWSFPAPEALRLKRSDEYIERFRDVLGAAVRDRLRTDRAAILLSGGLDSTALAATARRVAPSVELAAWTNDPGASLPPDELRLASEVAARLGMAHEIVRNAPAPFVAADEYALRTPEPLDEPDWEQWVGQLGRIASRAPVLVNGDDGDALFRPPGLLTMLRRWPAHDVLWRVATYTLSHGRHPHLGVWLRRRLRAPFAMFTPRAGAAPAWIRADFLTRAGGVAARRAEPAHPVRPDAVRYLTAPVWQPVLEAAQPAYTGVPLQIVWPLLDVRVIEFVFSVPPVPWCQRKELIRQAFRGELPDEVLTRPKSPLNGFVEEQTAHWRATWRPPGHGFGDAVREFVDTRRVPDTLEGASVAELFAVRRVFVLDQWLRHLEGPLEASSMRGR